ATYGHNGYIWTQDGAPAHTSKAIQKYLENKLGSKGFWSKEMWPPSSPNLNPWISPSGSTLRTRLVESTTATSVT
ncbi:Transposable element tcb1 transposase, partial [Caligus rogercresseyi]